MPRSVEPASVQKTRRVGALADTMRIRLRGATGVFRGAWIPWSLAFKSVLQTVQGSSSNNGYAGRRGSGPRAPRPARGFRDTNELTNRASLSAAKNRFTQRQVWAGVRPSFYGCAADDPQGVSREIFWCEAHGPS